MTTVAASNNEQDQAIKIESHITVPEAPINPPLANQVDQDEDDPLDAYMKAISVQRSSALPSKSVKTEKVVEVGKKRSP